VAHPQLIRVARGDGHPHISLDEPPPKSGEHLDSN
jgi:hypothetical protein